MAGRFVSTSRLSNIVQMISLSRQSGILRVVRGQGTTQEMGQIRFLDGQPVSALLAQLTGPNALNVLMNWGECAYAFDEALIADGADTGPGVYGQDPYGYGPPPITRSEEHTSELQSLRHLVCRLLLEKKNRDKVKNTIRT